MGYLSRRRCPYSHSIPPAEEGIPGLKLEGPWLSVIHRASGTREECELQDTQRECFSMAGMQQGQNRP